MFTCFGLMCAFLLVDFPVQTKFAQVAPAGATTPAFARSAGQTRAVVLVQGLRPHLFSKRKAAEAEWQSWQKPASGLVNLLAKEADVYAFAYSQNAPVERIADTRGFRCGIQQLRRLGYKEIVLVGHSAGGLVARQFVEDHPDAGVTKVIQICAPNGGATWAKVELAVRHEQEVFLESLTKKCRRECLANRAGKKVPEKVEFVCLVGQITLQARGAITARQADAGQGVTLATDFDKRGDGFVSCASQWPADLQGQGIPAVSLGCDHFSVLRSQSSLETIARLVREPQPRWNKDEVTAAKQRILGK